MLGGGLDPNRPAPLGSVYQGSYDPQLRQKVEGNTYPHKARFVDSDGRNVNQSLNGLAFVKGVDFNSKDKIDYDPISCLPKH